jgi:hypothetical protein
MIDGVGVYFLLVGGGIAVAVAVAVVVVDETGSEDAMEIGKGWGARKRDRTRGKRGLY